MSDQWKEISVEWLGDYAFKGINDSGGSLQLGTFEGQAGVSPMELLLFGIAGCTGVDVVSILNKKRKDLRDVKVLVRGKRALEHPKIWEEIEVVYQLWGKNLDVKSVEQAIQLSEEKYCSASAMLSTAAKISSSYKIFNVD